MSIEIKRAELVKKTDLSDTVKEYVFKMIEPTQLDFLPGQYVSISIGDGLRRPYSVSSWNQKNDTFELIIDITPNGKAINYLLNLELGSLIEFIGGIGRFTLPQNLSKRLFFISTGTGLAPLKSMIQFLTQSNFITSNNKKENKLELHFGTRYKSDIIYYDFFIDLLHKGFISNYQVYLSRQKDENFNQGYVGEFAKKLTSIDFNTGQFFICGGGDMVKSVESILINKGVSPDSIFYERYY